MAISCSSHKIGDKVYLEIWNRGTKLHIDKHCKNISKNHMVDFIDLRELANSHHEGDFISLCPECVSDDDADFLKGLMKNKPDTIISDNVHKLYQELFNEYDLGTEENFRQSLSKKENRNNLYNAIKNEYDVGTFKDFECYLGY